MHKKGFSAMLKKATRLLKSMKARSMKKCILRKHYSYGYVHEYQFSPSNSPLIHQYYKRAAKKRWYQECDSVFSMKAERKYPWRKKTISIVRNGTDRAYPLMQMRDSCVEEGGGEEEEVEDSIDERAERLIERFYEEIRIQRRQSSSLVQYNPFILDMD